MANSGNAALGERITQDRVFLQSKLEQHRRHLLTFPASKRWLGQGEWEGAMIAATECSADSGAARLSACCSSGKACLLPPVLSQCSVLPEFAVICCKRKKEALLRRKKQQKVSETTGVPSPLWCGCLPVWKAEMQCKRPVSKGTTVANFFA